MDTFQDSFKGFRDVARIEGRLTIIASHERHCWPILTKRPEIVVEAMRIRFHDDTRRAHRDCQHMEGRATAEKDLSTIYLLGRD